LRNGRLGFNAWLKKQDSTKTYVKRKKKTSEISREEEDERMRKLQKIRGEREASQSH
jgi:hypothetical protein